MAVVTGLGLTLSQITYIGDSETDSETAARAGARFGLFTEGYRQTAPEDMYHQFRFDRLPRLARPSERPSCMTTRRPLPPPLEIPKPGFGRRTPPALFPPIMGLFGLGLGWRAAAGAFGVSPAIGDLILGATSLLFLFTLAAYLAKPLRRPTAFMEDLRVLPGRAGLSAASLCLMLFAAVLAPMASGVATALGAFGLRGACGAGCRDHPDPAARPRRRARGHAGFPS